MVFLVMTPCSLVRGYHLYSKDWGSISLRNVVGTYPITQCHNLGHYKMTQCLFDLSSWWSHRDTPPSSLPSYSAHMMND